ncbi:Cytidylate kinase [bioreactor metagenome]|uniref:(d)CMP kinase n=1 Tax=bioreactor metagenome TaxID=1076179 RepID=A0A644T0J0_9ZZZZ|nr:(d)CMP kinase [Negativicutes bacterium]
MKKLTIAIDGPAGAGKSTVAQIAARCLKYTYIDTGAMYRAVTWLAMTRKISPQNSQALTDEVCKVDLKLELVEDKTMVYVDGIDVTEQIRTPEVSRKVAEIAQIPEIREVLILKQREMARLGGVVMDGRDISSCVLPDADVKIFLTASIEERAKRRWQELISTGVNVSLKNITHDIASRDKKDYEREIAPLKQVPDAMLIDTTGLTIEDTVQRILDACKERSGVV